MRKKTEDQEHLSELEIDRIVVAQAEDETAWETPIQVHRTTPTTVFSFPIYLEPDVNDYMSRIAEEKHLDLQTLVNEWLRSNIKIAQIVQK